VLEALNRLLDDNRELFVPELQEVVKPHPHFMLFATQNPPGAYAGRKVLSRAFRSRCAASLPACWWWWWWWWWCCCCCCWGFLAPCHLHGHPA
jgi:hypothetical protein